MVPLRLPSLVALAFALVAGSADAAWRWPVAGEVRADFSYSARAPFEPGQRRGVDVAARPGAVVVAACAGHVTYTGPVPERGFGVTVRCGRLMATHLGLGRVLVRRRARVRAGRAIGQVGAAGVVRLGARVAGRPFQYVDPLTLIGPAPRPLGPAPIPRSPGPPPVLRPAGPRAGPTAASPAPAGLPLAAWAGLAILASALPAGGVVRHRRRARRGLVPRPR